MDSTAFAVTVLAWTTVVYVVLKTVTEVVVLSIAVKAHRQFQLNKDALANPFTVASVGGAPTSKGN